MTLDYVALAILIVVVLLVVYGLVAAWGIPYQIAKARNHPHQDAIGAAFTRWEDEEPVSYADPNRVLSSRSSYQRLHPISDLLTAILDTGMTLELFHEFDVTPAPTPWLERRPDRLYGFAAGTRRFPLCYSLRACKPR